MFMIGNWSALPSLRNYPIYYFFLAIVCYIAFLAYVSPLYLIADDIQYWLYVPRIVTTSILSLLLTGLIFSNVSSLKKRKYAAIALSLLWAPMVAFGALALLIPGILAFGLGVGHYIFFRLLLFAAEYPHSKKGWFIIIGIGLTSSIVFSFLYTEYYATDKVKAGFNQMSDSLHAEVLEGRLTDPEVIQQRCLDLNRQSGERSQCRYDEFAVKTGNIKYCAYETTIPRRPEYWVTDCVFKVLKTEEEKAAYCRNIEDQEARVSCFYRLPPGTK